MTALPKHKLTEAEYLAIENAAEFKSEFYRGVMYPLYRCELTGMAGASRDHNRVKDNIAIRIGGLLFDRRCETYTSDQRVRLSLSGMYAYPDVVIVCDRPQFSEFDRNTLVNPQIVVEVFSPSTELYDRGFKFTQYRQQPTLREYIMVAQDEMRIERYVRQPDNSWLLTVFDDPAGDFELASVSARVAMADVYRGVELPPEISP